MNANLTVPSGESWTFNNITLNAAANTQFIINGTFSAEDLILNGNSTWDFNLASGSSTTLKNTTVNDGDLIVDGALTIEGTTQLGGTNATFSSTALVDVSTAQLNIAGTLSANSTTLIGDTKANSSIELQSSSTATLTNMTLQQAKLVQDTDNVTLVGTLTLEKAEILVKAGRTLTIPSGVTVLLGGDLQNASQIVVDGTLDIQGTIQCDDAGDLVIRYKMFSSGTIDMNCAQACIIAEVGSEVTFETGVSQSFSNGAFLANRKGTIVLEDGANIIYESTAGLLEVQEGSTFRMGSGSKMTFNDSANMVGTTINPIRFERLNAGQAWDRIQLNAGADGSTFNNVEIDGATYGLYIQAPNVTVSESVFDNNNVGLLATVHPNLTLSGNTISNSAAQNVIIQSGATATLDGNTISNSGSSALVIQNANTTATLTDNTISNGVFYGVRIRDGATATFTGANTISGTTGTGIQVIDPGSQATISGSGQGTSSTANTSVGLVVRNSATATVTGVNSFSGNTTHGVLVDQGGMATFTDALIDGNQQRGIYAKDASSRVTLVSGNTISNNTLQGIRAETGSSLTINANNTIADNSNTGIVVRNAGTTATITGSTITGNVNYGISVQGGAANAAITDNLIETRRGLG